jgi:hypothetical protein
MIALRTQLESEIYSEVKKLYKNSLDPGVEPEVFPFLSRIAEATAKEPFDGRNRYYGDVLKSLLFRAFQDSLPSLTETLNIGPIQVADGLKELFGLGKQRIVDSPGPRRDNAACLFGYKNGESLRQGERNGQKVIDLILAELCRQFALEAERQDVTLDPEPLNQMDTPLEAISRGTDPRDGDYALRALQLGRALFYELHRCASVGLETALAEGAMPRLSSLSRSATHISHNQSDASVDDVERVLDWAIQHIENDRHIRGAKDLFGMQKARGLDTSRRYDRAARHFGHESGERFIESYQEVWVITFVRDHLVRLAGHMEFWPVNEPPGTFF